MTSVADLTGGLDPSYEYALRDHPKIALMREGVSVWVYDYEGRFGFPRIALEAVGPDWNPKRLQVNLVFADGRVLACGGVGPMRSSEDDQGLRSVFSGGPLEFRCVEPFARWRISFDGNAVDTTSSLQIADTVDVNRTTRVRFEIETRAAAPPWITGTMSAEADGVLAASDAVFVGGRRSADEAMRYEQLLRATGTLQIGAENEWPFAGSGLRIHRQGLRNLQGFTGHVWQSALFSSGRGFGYMWLLPNDYREGFVYEDGRMIPAQIVSAPFMTKMAPAGEDLSLVLESELGRTVIEGESAYSNFIPANRPFPTEGSYGLCWQQAGVRYRWDGEETYGMIERSSLPEAMGR